LTALMSASVAIKQTLAKICTGHRAPRHGTSYRQLDARQALDVGSQTAASRACTSDACSRTHADTRRRTAEGKTEFKDIADSAHLVPSVASSQTSSSNARRAPSRSRRA
jgi:hypothetical protein